MTTLVQAWTRSRERLKAAGVDSPAIDARLLLEAAADASRADILTDPYRELTPEQDAGLVGFEARWRSMSTGERGVLSELSLFERRRGRWVYVEAAGED